MTFVKLRHKWEVRKMSEKKSRLYHILGDGGSGRGNGKIEPVFEVFNVCQVKGGLHVSLPIQRAVFQGHFTQFLREEIATQEWRTQPQIGLTSGLVEFNFLLIL